MFDDLRAVAFSSTKLLQQIGRWSEHPPAHFPTAAAAAAAAAVNYR